MTSVLVSKESSRAKHEYMNVNPTIKDLFMHLVVQLSSDINIANFFSHEVADLTHDSSLSLLYSFS